MTAENNGSGAAPESEDPFAYLYRQEGGDGSSADQRGAPRRSYNHVRAVGERQYGGQTAQAPQSFDGGYGNQSPSTHYAAPETMPGGRAAARQGSPQQPGARGGGHGGGGRRNGLLIGAIAVVAAVVIGICAAVFMPTGKDGGSEAGGSNGNSAGSSQGGDSKPKPKALHRGEQFAKQDASRLQLSGGATAASDVPNAQGKGGTYVGSMNNEGAAASWHVDNVPKAGKYTLFVRYGIPGKDAKSTLSVDGRPNPRPLSMKNFAGAPEGDWEKGWQHTYAWVQLKKGQNDLKVSCEQGDDCDFNLDQVWLKAGWVKG